MAKEVKQLFNGSPRDITKDIETHLNEGWELLGSVVCDDKRYFYAWVVREK